MRGIVKLLRNTMKEMPEDFRVVMAEAMWSGVEWMRYMKARLALEVCTAVCTLSGSERSAVILCMPYSFSNSGLRPGIGLEVSRIASQTCAPFSAAVRAATEAT